nr:hypothetical protein [uncultured Sphaerochaeta sp.]
MSNQYNNAGKSLIVDELIELKGVKKDYVAKFAQGLDAQLLKRDTSAIKAQIDVISSDNHVTPQEKQILAREYRIIMSNHALMVTKSEEQEITSTSEYQVYISAFNALGGYLQPLLEDLGTSSEIASHQEMMALFNNYYDTSSILEERFFQYTTGMLNGLDWRERFEVRINSTLGLSVPLDNTSTTLSVMLLHNGEDVTAEYPDTDFSWSRITEDRAGDAEWEEGKDLTGKTLTVSYSDLVYGYGSFMCKFKSYYSDSMYYEKSGFITLSKEVPGPPGEDAYQLQIISHNGTVFRTTDTFSTVMEARVWQGGEDITANFTDEDFRWRRVSEDTHADELWNAAHYSTGGRTLTITQDDVVGRSNFFCDLLRERS